MKDLVNFERYCRSYSRKNITVLNLLYSKEVKNKIQHKILEYQSLFFRLPETALKAAEEKLLKADYHGAELTVIKSKNPSLLNTSGIVLHETKNVFKLVTKQNKLKGIVG